MATLYFLFASPTAMEWRHVQGVPRLLPDVSWDGVTLYTGYAAHDGWMDGFALPKHDGN